MAEDKRIRIIHYHSNVGNTPLPENLELGEIALSTKDGEEKLFIKNTEGEIITTELGGKKSITTDDVVASQDIEVQGEVLMYSGDSLTSGLTYLMDVMYENERVTAEAINTLGEEIGYAQNDIEDIYKKLNNLGSNTDKIQIARNITLSGRTIATTDNNTTEAFQNFLNVIAEDERVTSHALNDLNERIENMQFDPAVITEMIGEAFSKDYTVEDALNDTEEVFAAAANDLNDRILAMKDQIEGLIEGIDEEFATKDELDDVVTAMTNQFADVLNTLSGDIATNYATKAELTNAVTAETARTEATYAKFGDIEDAIEAETARTEAAYAKPDDITSAMGAESARTEATYVKEGDITAAIEAETARTEAAYAGKAYEGYVDTLVGEDDGKSAREIALEELTKQLIPESAQTSLDTLKEIAEWIQHHPQDAAAINAILAGLGTGEDALAPTVTAYTDNKIAELDAEISGVSPDGQVTVSVAEVDGKITGIGVDCNIVLEDMITKNVKFEKDVTYSGYTVAASGSNVTDAFENLLIGVIDNEEIVAAALNDLDGRINDFTTNPTDYISVSDGITIEDNSIKIDETWLDNKLEVINGGEY